MRPLLVLALLAAGCGTSRPGAGDPSAAELTGPTWHLVSLGGDAVPASASVTLTFGADGAVSGSSGCNRFSGTVEIGPADALAVSPLASTRRACAPPMMAREQAFLTALGAADRAVVTDGELWLRGATPLRFSRSNVEPDAAARATLDGTVTYLPRIALAPDAVVTVRLLDVSLADAPAVTLAEHTLRPEGRQVPLPFALTYDPARIEARRRYHVRAEIHDADGALRWTTDTALPVLTQGAPTTGVEVRVVQVGDDKGRSDLLPSAERVYACEGFAFNVTSRPGSVTLRLPERFAGRDGGAPLVLDRVVSASGAKYQGGSVMVWMRDDEARLEVDGETFTGCMARG